MACLTKRVGYATIHYLTPYVSFTCLCSDSGFGILRKTIHICNPGAQPLEYLNTRGVVGHENNTESYIRPLRAVLFSRGCGMKKYRTLQISITVLIAFSFLIISCGGGSGKEEYLYFRADDGVNGSELWVYDGVSAPTMVADINSAGQSQPNELTPFKGRLFFRADDGVNGTELWSYDGNSDPVMVTDINPSGPAGPYSLTQYDGDLYFAATNGIDGDPNSELWVLDSSSNSASMVTDIYKGTTFFEIDGGISEPAVYDGKLYFSMNDGIAGKELWCYDADTGEALMAADIWSGSDTSHSLPYNLIVFKEKLYFTAKDGVNGVEMWVYDGANAPTMVADINTAGYSNPQGFTVFDGKLFFTANDGIHGSELWQYDGVSTPSMVADMNTAGNSSPSFYTAYNNLLYFSADNGTDGRELWVYDGIAAPSMVSDINTNGDSEVYWLTVFKDKLYFNANDGVIGRELWVYDGVNEPLLVADIRVGWYPSQPSYLTVFRH